MTTTHTTPTPAVDVCTKRLSGANGDFTVTTASALGRGICFSRFHERSNDSHEHSTFDVHHVTSVETHTNTLSDGTQVTCMTVRTASGEDVRINLFSAVTR